MQVTPQRQTRGFSLIELVIVIVIIGVIGAIAIPRMTRGANNAGSSALKADLQVLRGAIELYRAEHEGKFPLVASFNDQMLQYTDITGGNPGTTPDIAAGRKYGPYLAAIPALPVGDNKGNTGVAATNGVGVGWIYNQTTGTIRANSVALEADQDGVDYDTY